MRRWLSGKSIWIILCALALGGWAYTRPFKKVASSNLGSVTRGDLIQRVTIAGSLNPKRKTLISAPYNAYIRKLYVQIGQAVKDGDPIVSLAQSLRGNAEDSFPLRAPFAGIVVQVLKTEGEFVEQGIANSLVRIDDLSQLFVEASAPEIEVDKLKIGQEVVIKASAILGRSYKGKIDRISLAAKEQKDWDKSRVEFPVMIQVLDHDAQLKPGMSVIVDIITGKLKNVLTVRHEFIQKEGDKYFVVTENGTKKSVEVGIQNEDFFEIKGGVAEGEKIRQTDFLSLLKDR